VARTLKASKRHAEVLCRRLVFDRARPRIAPGDVGSLSMCEWVYPDTGRCREPAVDWAHNVPRRFSVTRCEPDNAWALCRRHHELIDRDPEEKRKLVEATIGLVRWAELRQMAYAGLNGVGLSPLMFWRREETRLEAACLQLGLTTTHRG
jgi:hypothetical protein